MADDPNAIPSDPLQIIEEAETLTWALLDDQLDDVETHRLMRLLEANAQARSHYIDCVQLHIDLANHYAGTPTSAARRGAPGTTVLGSLGLSGLPADVSPPVSE